MKKSKFSESQIIKILSQQDSGQSVSDICREHGISQGTFYSWKSKYSGMEVSGYTARRIAYPVHSNYPEPSPGFPRLDLHSTIPSAADQDPARELHVDHARRKGTSQWDRSDYSVHFSTKQNICIELLLF